MMEFWFYQIPAKSDCYSRAVQCSSGSDSQVYQLSCLFPNICHWPRAGMGINQLISCQVWFWAKTTLLVFLSSQRLRAPLWYAKGLEWGHSLELWQSQGRGIAEPQRGQSPRVSDSQTFRQRLWGLSPAQPLLLLCTALSLFPWRKTVMM